VHLCNNVIQQQGVPTHPVTMFKHIDQPEDIDMEDEKETPNTRVAAADAPALPASSAPHLPQEVLDHIFTYTTVDAVREARHFFYTRKSKGEALIRCDCNPTLSKGGTPLVTAPYAITTTFGTSTDQTNTPDCTPSAGSPTDSIFTTTSSSSVTNAPVTSGPYYGSTNIWHPLLPLLLIQADDKDRGRAHHRGQLSL
jgi:hypothetical protein